MIVQIEDDGNIAELLKILPEAVSTFRQAAIIKDYNLTAQWYDLKTCHALRGVGSFLTFKNTRWYQPKGGIPDDIVQGLHSWSRETVAEWLCYCTDKKLPEYHKKYCTGARNPKENAK